MTRINCLPPAELCGQHLVAEYRELPRVFGLVRAAAARGERPDDPRNPSEYVLGRGHVRFFYPRLLYLSWRHVRLVDEMEARGYRPRFVENLRVTHGDIPSEWWEDWDPTPEAMDLCRARVDERLAEMVRTGR